MSAHGYKFLPASFMNKLRNVDITVSKPISGSRQNQHRSTKFGSSVEFAQYREYYEGDPVERIDWSVYARNDRFVIRQSFEEVNAQTYVLLDISSSMNWKGTGNMTKLEFGSFLAAGFLYKMVTQGDSATLVTFDSKIQYHKPLVSSATGIREMLVHLENIEATSPGDIRSALHEIADMAKGKVLVVLISDLLQEPDDIMNGIHRLYHDGKDISVFNVLDPKEISLNGSSGLTQFTEKESGEKMVIDVDSIKTTYQRYVQKHLSSLQKRCNGLGLYYNLCDTTQEPYEPIINRGIV